VARCATAANSRKPRPWLWVPAVLAAIVHPILGQTAVETALKATVTIIVAGPDGQGHGSGFVVSSDGLIVTAAHVIEGATSATVWLQNGEELDIEDVIVRDRAKDFAIVRVAGVDLPTVPLGNADDVSVGQRVIVIGAPMEPSLAGTVSDGLVAARRVVNGTRRIQISAPISPGNSGGPVLTEAGQVIGLVLSGIVAEGAENLNFALPINYVLESLSLSSEPTPRSISPGASDLPDIDQPNNDQAVGPMANYLADNWAFIALLVGFLVSLPFIVRLVSNTDYWKV
jgi:serine protease Do